MALTAKTRISETERIALDAGTVWLERDLFRGRPDFPRIADSLYPGLTDDEQRFLDGPVEAVCRSVDPWRLAREGVLPEATWNLLRREGFFGLAIALEWGGKGFSALGLSAVFGKLASRSLGLSAYVLIPNSVGPGELLAHYGTPEQQARYLPRLAKGEEIPCFALTEPEAGSDASSLRSKGVVFRDTRGEPAIRLDWEKRTITLAPVATLLGLAVRLYDPEELLGRGPEPGISVVLVPARNPGVEIGLRHDPLGVPFPNGPTRGRGVVVPATAILGGQAGAGQGWRMLMEALAAGRAVSLPAQSAAGVKQVARVVGAWAAVRRQFGLPLGRFEAVTAELAEIAGAAYLVEAARVWSCGALAAGERPAVVAAIMKLRTTELARSVVARGMDVLAGAGICRGPSNLLAEGWAGAPIGITVEGANLLTRSLILFGQALLRCHPTVLAEAEALERGDRRALTRELARHLVFAGRNTLRLLRLELSRGRFARTGLLGPAGHWARRLAWGSARFAVLVELALLAHGPAIKRRERATGRLADALSWLYLGAAVLKRFTAEGARREDEAAFEWASRSCLGEAGRALEALVEQLPLPRLLRSPLALWLRARRLAAPPSEALAERLAAEILAPGPARDRLTGGLFVPGDLSEPLARLERALQLVTAPGSASPAEVEAARLAALAVDELTFEQIFPEAPLEAALAAAQPR
ncbi:MAG TPA: acyl-CoA dehydrogenase [Thermoanaerobaculia bacterium]|nr:acyl-CoA dehydrogenase [Thermoanaerobaculia bacterium]